MAFLTEDEFKALEVTASATEIPPAVISDLLRKAKDLLAKWCGEAAVATVEAATNEDLLQTRNFRDAQQLIAKAKLLMFIASRYRSGGVQVSEKDLNDTSVNSYERYDEARARYDDLMREAREAVDSYVLTESLNEPAFEEGVVLTDSCLSYSTCCDV